MEDEVTIIICLPVEGHPGRYLVPGTVQHQCKDCGTKVWVAPSGHKIISERAATVVCMNCAEIRLNKESRPLEITGEQVEEIKAWNKRN